MQCRSLARSAARSTAPSACSSSSPATRTCARPTAESLVLTVDALLPARDVQADSRSAAPIGLVLYIEDNSINAMLIQHVVERRPDVLLVIAIDGASGIAQTRALQPDIVLLDMQLADMTGLEVIEALRGAASTRALRVVACRPTPARAAWRRRRPPAPWTTGPSRSSSTPSAGR